MLLYLARNQETWRGDLVFVVHYLFWILVIGARSGPIGVASVVFPPFFLVPVLHGYMLLKIDDAVGRRLLPSSAKYVSRSEKRRSPLFVLPLFPEQIRWESRLRRTNNQSRSCSKKSAHGDGENAGGALAAGKHGAYIQIPSFANHLFEDKAVANVSQLQKAKTLVIDVRNNAGGVKETAAADRDIDGPQLSRMEGIYASSHQLVRFL
jgi:hypothetical protein